MKKHGLLLIAALLWITLLHAQTATIVGSVFDLPPSAGPDTLDLPLALDKLQVADLVLKDTRPLYARLENRSDPAFRNAIALRIDPAGPFLQVIIQPAALSLAGNYMVSLLYGKKGSAAFSTINFTLVRPPAVLESVNKVKITLQGCTLTADPLIVRETSGRSGVTGLKPEPPCILGTNERGLISFPGSPIQVAAGSYRALDYSVNPDLLGHLPLGETTATLQLHSLMMAAPVQVNFDIWNKRSKWWIIGAVFLGLLAGLFVRHYLKNRQAAANADADGQVLKQQITSETAGIGDQAYNLHVNALMSQLTTALAPAAKWWKPADPAALAAAVLAVKTDYAAARAAFVQSLADVKAAYLLYAVPVFDNNRQPVLLDSLGQPRKDLVAVKQAIDGLDPTTASSALQTATDHFNTATKNLLLFDKDLLAFLSQAPLLPAEASASTKARLTDRLADLQDALSTAKADTSGPRQLLIDLDDLQSLLVILPRSLYQYLLSDYQSLDSVAAASGPFLDALTKWATTLAAILKPVQQEGATLIWPPSATTALESAWKAAKAPKKELAAISDNTTTSHPGYVPEKAPLQPSFPYDPAGQKLALLEISRSLAAARLRGFWYGAVQTVLLTFVLGLAAFKTYGPDFVGTWEELITIFLVAFSLDITVDNVTQLKK